MLIKVSLDSANKRISCEGDVREKVTAIAILEISPFKCCPYDVMKIFTASEVAGNNKLFLEILKASGRSVDGRDQSAGALVLGRVGCLLPRGARDLFWGALRLQRIILSTAHVR